VCEASAERGQRTIWKSTVTSATLTLPRTRGRKGTTRSRGSGTMVGPVARRSSMAPSRQSCQPLFRQRNSGHRRGKARDGTMQVQRSPVPSVTSRPGGITRSSTSRPSNKMPTRKRVDVPPSLGAVFMPADHCSRWASRSPRETVLNHR